jgi:hypothetical protein
MIRTKSSRRRRRVFFENGGLGFYEVSRKFPYWFSKDLQKYVLPYPPEGFQTIRSMSDQEKGDFIIRQEGEILELPFDYHMMIAILRPTLRNHGVAVIASATGDYYEDHLGTRMSIQHALDVEYLMNDSEESLAIPPIQRSGQVTRFEDGVSIERFSSHLYHDVRPGGHGWRGSNWRRWLDIVKARQ